MIEAVHTDWAGPQKTIGWKQMKEISGGHLYHHMHEVDLICQLAGLPVSVYAKGKNLVHHGDGCGDEEEMCIRDRFKRALLGKHMRDNNSVIQR